SIGKSIVICLMVVSMTIFPAVLGSPPTPTPPHKECIELGQHCIGNKLCCTKFCDRSVYKCAPYPEL
ncbi:unnamed protein product, partial [Allacma fusca]